MFPISLVVFREGMEIALIVGVILAATRSLAKRTRWVLVGILVGILGSIIIACLADGISQIASGMGQELFNAFILILAAVLIGWTTVWMSGHGSQMTKELKILGHNVQVGIKPVYMLAVVIALSVFREGSEIVMFLYSSFLTEKSTISLIVGFCIGILSSSFIGVVLYFGIIRIPIGKVLKVTSWMLVFLVAGMVMQAVGYLIAAGCIPEIIPVVWDSSAFLSSRTFLGEILQVLIGYTDRPAGSQVIAYLITIGGLFMALNNNMSRQTRKVLVVLVIFVFSICFTQEAHATKKVYSPLVERGELEFEARGNYDTDDRAAKDNVQKHKYAIGYGLNDYWFTEIYGEFERTKNDDAQDNEWGMTAISWENRFQLTEQGKYWVDFGLYMEYELSLEDKHADKVETKILLEKSLINFTHTFNINFEQEVGRHTTADLEGGLAWSSRYKLSKVFEPGFEYHVDFGELSQLRSFHEQKHQSGPVFYGKFGKVKYDVGYLFGLSDASPKGEVKWIVEYEIKF